MVERLGLRRLEALAAEAMSNVTLKLQQVAVMRLRQRAAAIRTGERGQDGIPAHVMNRVATNFRDVAGNMFRHRPISLPSYGVNRPDQQRRDLPAARDVIGVNVAR